MWGAGARGRGNFHLREVGRVNFATTGRGANRQQLGSRFLFDPRGAKTPGRANFLLCPHAVRIKFLSFPPARARGAGSGAWEFLSTGGGAWQFCSTGRFFDFL